MGIQESGWDPLILVALVSCLHHNLLLTTQDRKVSNFRFKGGVFIFAFYYTMPRHSKLLTGQLRRVLSLIRLFWFCFAFRFLI